MKNKDSLNLGTIPFSRALFLIWEAALVSLPLDILLFESKEFFVSDLKEPFLWVVGLYISGFFAVLPLLSNHLLLLLNRGLTVRESLLQSKKFLWIFPACIAALAFLEALARGMTRGPLALLIWIIVLGISGIKLYRDTKKTAQLRAAKPLSLLDRYRTIERAQEIFLLIGIVGARGISIIGAHVAWSDHAPLLWVPYVASSLVLLLIYRPARHFAR